MANLEVTWQFWWLLKFLISLLEVVQNKMRKVEIEGRETQERFTRLAQGIAKKYGGEPMLILLVCSLNIWSMYKQVKMGLKKMNKNNREKILSSDKIEYIILSIFVRLGKLEEKKQNASWIRKVINSN